MGTARTSFNPRRLLVINLTWKTGSRMTVSYSYKYIAYDLTDNEFYMFNTEEEAKQFVLDVDGSEGFSEEQMNGGVGIAKIKSQAFYTATEFREDYEKDGEEWPYDDEFHSVGKLVLKDAIE